MGQSSENVLNNEINTTDPYLYIKEIETYNHPTLSTIVPVPSQILRGKLKTTFKLTRSDEIFITLDSGATVSYIRLSKVLELGIPIGENGQLAVLADQKTRMASLGEIDIEVVVDNVIIRLRALVMKELQAEVYGGTTLHTDNNMTAYINVGEVLIHGKFRVKQFNPLRQIQRFTPSSQRLESQPLLRNISSSTKNPTLNIAASQVALPNDTVHL